MGLVLTSGWPIAASTTERASCIGSEGFLPDSRFLGFPFGLLVCFLAVNFLALDCAFLRDFNVPRMPAWVINKAFWKSSRIFFMAMPHHATAESESH